MHRNPNHLWKHFINFKLPYLANLCKHRNHIRIWKRVLSCLPIQEAGTPQGNICLEGIVTKPASTGTGYSFESGSRNTTSRYLLGGNCQEAGIVQEARKHRNRIRIWIRKQEHYKSIFARRELSGSRDCSGSQEAQEPDTHLETIYKFQTLLPGHVFLLSNYKVYTYIYVYALQ